jgi:hypothetical protein
MLQIDRTVLSFDILQKKFACDLKKCKGACCVYGDSGAPLEDDEVEVLGKIFPFIRPFMREEGVKAVEEQGVFLIDADNDKVTPLVNGRECAYVIFEEGIAKCAIEKACENKVIEFKKPVSCHLYPARITKYSDFEALNYHQWEICKHAVANGNKNDVPLYVYLQDSLVRKYGEEWYKQLKIASVEVLKRLEP